MQGNGVTQPNTFQLVYGNGNNSSNPADNGNSALHHHTGSDKYVLTKAALDAEGVTATSDNATSIVNTIWIYDFIIDDVDINSDADILGLGSLLRAYGADVNNDGVISAEEATPYLHITPDSVFGTNLLYRYNDYIKLDLAGAYNNNNRRASSDIENAAISDGLADLVYRMRDASGQNQYISEITGLPYSNTDAGVQALIQALMDLGFLELN